ncbi:MAG: hypothetical protein IT377_19910 [Polyangiaceae bacterium]|nr:hypothetical protein [Polyangiaceae bacterium]
MTLDAVKNFVTAALEVSIYVAPRDHGLTVAEMVQLGSLLGLHEGEIHDAVKVAHRGIDARGGRLCLNQDGVTHLADFLFEADPDPRNWRAFEFIHVHLRQLARRVQQVNARVERSVLVAHGEREGLRRHDLDVAITLMLLTAQLDERDGALGYVRGREAYALPSVQVEQRQGDRAFPARRKEWLAKVLPLIPDVLARRTDGRPVSIEPLDAFAERLTALGHSPFAVWWRQTVSELRLADPARMPITITVLAASLAEASLALVVKTAQSSGGSMTKNLPDPPKQWKFDQLAKAAKTGPNPILDEPLFQRCMMLNEIRQRIHAGRLLERNPEGPHPDTRPEEARDAKAILDALLRRLLDWLDASKSSRTPS